MINDVHLRVIGPLDAVAAGTNPTGEEILDTAVSADTIDLQVARDIGEGANLYAVFTVTTAVTRAAGACTVTFEVITSASADLSAPTVIASSDAIPKATLVAGYQHVLRVPPSVGGTGQRYLGLQMTFSAAADTGEWLGDFVHDIQDGKKFYSSGFAVS